MKLNIFKTLALGVLVMGFTACEKDYNKADYDRPLPESTPLPQVATGTAGAFAETAIIDASITPVEGMNIQSWGLLVGANENLTLSSAAIMLEGDADQTSQTFAVSGLTDKTQYYYCTYATNGVDVAYSEIATFTTNGDGWETAEAYVGFATAEEADAYLPYRAILDASHSSAFGFTTVSMFALYEQEFYGVASTLFEPNMLFNELTPKQATITVTNAAGFKMDFTGMYFPKVYFDVEMMQAFFGATDYPGHFDMYVSNTPIETLEDLEAAVKIGSSKDEGSAQELYVTNMYTSSTDPIYGEIPMEYWGEAYVYIVNAAVYDAAYGDPNFGIVIYGYGLEASVAKSAE